MYYGPYCPTSSQRLHRPFPSDTDEDSDVSDIPTPTRSRISSPIHKATINGCNVIIPLEQFDNRLTQAYVPLNSDEANITKPLNPDKAIITKPIAKRKIMPRRISDIDRYIIRKSHQRKKKKSDHKSLPSSGEFVSEQGSDLKLIMKRQGTSSSSKRSDVIPVGVPVKISTRRLSTRTPQRRYDLYDSEDGEFRAKTPTLNDPKLRRKAQVLVTSCDDSDDPLNQMSSNRTVHRTPSAKKIRPNPVLEKTPPQVVSEVAITLKRCDNSPYLKNNQHDSVPKRGRSKSKNNPPSTPTTRHEVRAVSAPEALSQSQVVPLRRSIRKKTIAALDEYTYKPRVRKSNKKTEPKSVVPPSQEMQTELNKLMAISADIVEASKQLPHTSKISKSTNDKKSKKTVKPIINSRRAALIQKSIMSQKHLEQKSSSVSGIEPITNKTKTVPGERLPSTSNTNFLHIEPVVAASSDFNLAQQNKDKLDMLEMLDVNTPATMIVCSTSEESNTLTETLSLDIATESLPEMIPPLPPVQNQQEIPAKRSTDRLNILTPSKLNKKFANISLDSSPGSDKISSMALDYSGKALDFSKNFNWIESQTTTTIDEDILLVPSVEKVHALPAVEPDIVSPAYESHELDIEPVATDLSCLRKSTYFRRYVNSDERVSSSQEGIDDEDMMDDLRMSDETSNEMAMSSTISSTLDPESQLDDTQTLNKETQTLNKETQPLDKVSQALDSDDSTMNIVTVPKKRAHSHVIKFCEKTTNKSSVDDDVSNVITSIAAKSQHIG